MADVAARGITSAGWLRHSAGLKEEYLVHILEEETEQFAEAERTLSEKDQRYIRQVLAAARKLKRQLQKSKRR